MPRLTSGRHVAVVALGLVDYVTGSNHVSVYGFVAAYRRSVQDWSHLRAVLPVIYYHEGKGEPPGVPGYASGFLVQDILSGQADWSSQEIQEFAEWLDQNEPLNKWLSENFGDVDAAVRNSHIWPRVLIPCGGTPEVKH